MQELCAGAALRRSTQGTGNTLKTHVTSGQPPVAPLTRTKVDARCPIAGQAAPRPMLLPADSANVRRYRHNEVLKNIFAVRG
jgi:hypothetical protein